MPKINANLKNKRLDPSLKNNAANARLSTMKIETVVDNNLAIICVNKHNGDQGYTFPIHKAVTKKHIKIPDELKHQGLDVCDSDRYLFFRKSHENDSRVKVDSNTTNNSTYNRTAFCAMPAEQYYESNGDLCEEKVVNQMVSSYCKLHGENKTPEQLFNTWNKDTDSSTEQPNRCLDHVLTDESVKEVLKCYFIPSKILSHGIYEYMRSNEIDGFFSRHQNGKFSDYAIRECGFPNDIVEKADYSELNADDDAEEDEIDENDEEDDYDDKDEDEDDEDDKNDLANFIVDDDDDLDDDDRE